MKFFVLAAALAIGSYGASLARSAGDPLESITSAFETSLARNVYEPDISVNMGQVVATSGEFIYVSWSVRGHRID